MVILLHVSGKMATVSRYVFWTMAWRIFQQDGQGKPDREAGQFTSNPRRDGASKQPSSVTSKRELVQIMKLDLQAALQPSATEYNKN